MTGSADDEISAETWLMVIRVRERAALTPRAGDIATLMTSAAGDSDLMPAGEIRAHFRDAITQAEQVAYLLGKLAGLLGEAGEP